MSPIDFDRVVVLSLARRPERMARFWREMPYPQPFPPVRHVQAIDGEQVPPPPWYAAQPRDLGSGVVISQPNSRETMRGAWGCLRSHHRAWEDALNAGASSLLVFEDDAMFCPNFAFRFQQFLDEVPDDWDQLYFGGQHVVEPQVVNSHVLKCGNVARTHAYAIRREMMAAAYEAMAETFASTIDAREYHVDYQLGQLHASGKWNVYAPMRWLVGQAGGASDVLSTGRDPGEQWWHR